MVRKCSPPQTGEKGEKKAVCPALQEAMPQQDIQKPKGGAGKVLEENPQTGGVETLKPPREEVATPTPLDTQDLGKL